MYLGEGSPRSDLAASTGPHPYSPLLTGASPARASLGRRCPPHQNGTSNGARVLVPPPSAVFCPPFTSTLTLVARGDATGSCHLQMSFPCRFLGTTYYITAFEYLSSPIKFHLAGEVLVQIEGDCR